MSEVLAHFTDGKCSGKPSPVAATSLPATPVKTPTGPTPARKRGRPRKSETPQESTLSVRREDEYEELPRISAPPSTGENSGVRRTRYSAGKIKRLDVLTLLGGRIKEEPADDEDGEYKPAQSLVQKGKKRLLAEDGLEVTGETPGPRRRGRPPKKLRLYGTPGSVGKPTDCPENLNLMTEHGFATVTVKNEGNSKVIVVSTVRHEDSELGVEQQGLSQKTPGKRQELLQDPEEEQESEIGEDGHLEADEGAVVVMEESGEGSQMVIRSMSEIEKKSGKDIESEEVKGIGELTEKEGTAQLQSEEEHLSENAGNVESEPQDNNEGTEEEKKQEEEDKESDEQGKETSTVRDRSLRVQKATQRTVYSYTGLPNKKRQNKCKICKQRFFYTDDELNIHSECHTNQKGEKEAYSCAMADCGYASVCWNRMLEHLITHDDYRTRLKDAPFLRNIIGSFSCPICKKKFDRKNNMKGHISKVHYKQSRVCEICGVTLTCVDDKTYKRHVEKCQHLLFKCSHCDYKSPVSANMRKHMKIHLGQGFTCEICQAVFPTKQRYTVHREIHETNRRHFMCEFCGQPFVSQDAVKKHVVRFHTEITTLFSCPECSFTSKIQTDLKKHIVSVHNKKFRCLHCVFQSNSSSAFEQHQEYHKPGRSWACNYPSCFYRGATGKQLSNHISQVHKQSRKHECPICHKLYKKKTHLARHLVVHTGDKPYVCLDCDAAFSSHSTYYRHRQKTGHDAKREGIVSVPQNITIQYISPQEAAFSEEGGNTKFVLEQPQGTFTEEAVEYIQSPENGEQAESEEKQNIIILENENGEQVTYLLKSSEDGSGEIVMVTEDGVPMEAGLAQQIQAQLAHLQDPGTTQQPEVQEVQITTSSEQLPEGIQIIQEEVAEEEGAPSEMVIYTEGAEVQAGITEAGNELLQVVESVGQETAHQQEVVHHQQMGEGVPINIVPIEEVEEQTIHEEEVVEGVEEAVDETILLTEQNIEQQPVSEVTDNQLVHQWVQVEGAPDGLVSEVVTVDDASNNLQVSKHSFISYFELIGQVPDLCLRIAVPSMEQ